MSRMASFFVLIAIILVIGVLFFKVMVGFLVPLFFAGVAVVMFRPLHTWLLKKCRNRERTAAALTTATILLVTLLPALIVCSLALVEGSRLLTRLDAGTLKARLATLRGNLKLDMPLAPDVRAAETALEALFSKPGVKEPSREERRALTQRLVNRVAVVRSHMAERPPHDPPVDLDPLTEAVQTLAQTDVDAPDFDIALQVVLRQFRDVKLTLFGGAYRAWLVDLANPSDEQVQASSAQVFRYVRDWLLSVGSASTSLAGQLALGIVIMALAVYFFFLDGPAMVEAIMRLSPLDDRYERELLDEFDRISRAVVLATLLSALAQGLLAGCGYWWAGLDYVLLLTLLSIVMALVPVFGAAVIWVPACLWLAFYEGRIGAAIFLTVWGLGVVSMVDNFIKPAILHGRSNLHPLLALLSVIGGVQALGPIGILVGPMVVAFLQTLLNILHRELLAMEQPGGKDEQLPAEESPRVAT
jgi:predicted PurR-regulated permease PerM